MEKPINVGGKTIGWAFIELKTLDRPRGWRYGVIGYKWSADVIRKFS
jgi:hypothetical protein